MQYDFNREAAKISALLSGKIDKYKYIAGEEILPLDQSRITKHARFNYLVACLIFVLQTVLGKRLLYQGCTFIYFRMFSSMIQSQQLVLITTLQQNNMRVSKIY